MRTKIKHVASSQLATTTLQQKGLTIFLENRDGIHTHERNGEKFTGEQSACPLCENGSEFERSFGRIGA
jgi:hypothetical protein